jgi:hypothetical protein
VSDRPQDPPDPEPLFGPGATLDAQDEEAVRRVLRADDAGPLPADVGARIQAALREAAAGAGTASAEPAAKDTAQHPAGVLSPLRRRLPRLALAAAAVAVVAGGVAVSGQLSGPPEASVTAGGSAEQGEELRSRVQDEAGTAEQDDGGDAEAAAPAPESALTQAPVLATGTDYTPDAVEGQVRELVRVAGAAVRAETPQAGADVARAPQDAPLAAPGAVARCALDLGGPDAQALVVDLATWQGGEAAIVVLPTRDGQAYEVWTVNRSCDVDATPFVYTLVQP